MTVLLARSRQLNRVKRFERIERFWRLRPVVPLVHAQRESAFRPIPAADARKKSRRIIILSCDRTRALHEPNRFECSSVVRLDLHDQLILLTDVGVEAEQQRGAAAAEIRPLYL